MVETELCFTCVECGLSFIIRTPIDATSKHGDVCCPACRENEFMLYINERNPGNESDAE